jgi:hypothetical protein
MDSQTHLRERVEVVAQYRTDVAEVRLCYPYKMKYQGREITFSEMGLRHPTLKGKRMVHVFDMSDGGTDYRLEFDAERLVWHLINIGEAWT